MTWPKARPDPERGGQRGAATVFVASATATLVLLGAALMAGAGLVLSHRRAQAAADLVALTAAAQGDCSRADALAARNGAELVSCRMDGPQAWVRVRSRSPGWWGRFDDLDAEARAGPTGW